MYEYQVRYPNTTSRRHSSLHAENGENTRFRTSAVIVLSLQCCADVNTFTWQR